MRTEGYVSLSIDPVRFVSSQLASEFISNQQWLDRDLKELLGRSQRWQWRKKKSIKYGNICLWKMAYWGVLRPTRVPLIAQSSLNCAHLFSIVTNPLFCKFNISPFTYQIDLRHRHIPENCSITWMNWLWKVGNLTQSFLLFLKIFTNYRLRIDLNRVMCSG